MHGWLRTHKGPTRSNECMIEENIHDTDKRSSLHILGSSRNEYCDREEHSTHRQEVLPTIWGLRIPIETIILNVHYRSWYAYNRSIPKTWTFERVQKFETLTASNHVSIPQTPNEIKQGTICHVVRQRRHIQWFPVISIRSRWIISRYVYFCSFRPTVWISGQISFTVGLVLRLSRTTLEASDPPTMWLIHSSTWVAASDTSIPSDWAANYMTVTRTLPEDMRAGVGSIMNVLLFKYKAPCHFTSSFTHPFEFTIRV